MEKSRDPRQSSANINSFQLATKRTADGPRDALCQLKYYHLLLTCTKNPFWKSLQKVNQPGGHSRWSELPLLHRW